MSRKKPEKKSRGRLGGLSRGIAEKAARNHPVWRWPDVADTLAGQHGVEAVQCLAALMEFRPWMADPGGGRTRWSVVDHARELALSPEELLEIYRIHRWAGDMEWDAVNKCHRPPSARQCLPSGRVWGAPRMQDEELIDCASAGCGRARRLRRLPCPPRRVRRCIPGPFRSGTTPGGGTCLRGGTDWDRLGRPPCRTERRLRADAGAPWRASAADAGFAGVVTAQVWVNLLVGLLASVGLVGTLWQRQLSEHRDRIQRLEQDARIEWWRRFQWAAEQTTQEDRTAQSMGWALIESLVESPLLTASETGIVVAITNIASDDGGGSQL